MDVDVEWTLFGQKEINKRASISIVFSPCRHSWRQTHWVNRLHKVLARKRGPRKVALEGLGCSLSKADFHAMSPDELRDQPECQSEYIFNVAVNMQHASMAAELGSLEGEIHCLLLVMAKEILSRIGFVHFGN